MGKLVLVIFLCVVGVVLVSAIMGKNPISFIVGFSYEIKSFINRVIKREKHKVFDHGWDENTINPPSLIMYQLKSPSKNIFNKNVGSVRTDLDKYIFCEHRLYGKLFTDRDNNPLSVTISRPDANHGTVKLYADVNNNNQYDIRNATTHDALSVNEQAIVLGQDEKGFYGEVSHPNAKVYIYNEENELVRLAFGQQFDINPKERTFIRIGYQHLCFEEYELDTDIFRKSNEETADEDLGIMDVIKNIGARKDNDESEIKSMDEPKTQVNAGEVKVGARQSGNPLTQRKR